ncbi:MAG TPA: hypothetical protein VL528_04290 [Oxalicibacterium sp.]|nr:hypothetical protein [Oxalicibacterium sp.]
MSTEPRSAHENLAQRKERLMLQCRAYRAAVHHSRAEVRSHLGMQAIGKAALGLVGLRAGSAALSNFSGVLDLKNGVSFSKLLPVLAGGYSLLRRRSFLKPLLRGALIVGGAGAAAYFYAHRKSSKSRHDHAAHHEHL